MEDVFGLYCEPYNPTVSLVAMDELPVQLIKETRSKIAATPGHPERIDYEHESNGTAAIFMFTEPLGGWRRVNARERRTRVDWAYEIKHLLDVDFPQAEKVNLNTHTIASLYEAFRAD